MMILSRIWYVILALLIAAAAYVVFLAVGQFNRSNAAAAQETLKSDSQVVSWALQVDARRRLDALLLASNDATVVKAVRGANGKEQIPAPSRDEAVKALRAFNDKLPAEYKNDVLFAIDRDGRLVGQVGYDAANAFAEFELGGYAAANDALHGFLRDDTWVWGGRIARIVTRPVEDEVGQPPLGAVIGMRWVDNGFAKEIGKRTRTNLAFFAVGKQVAAAANTEGFEENALQALGADLKAVSEDKQFKEQGRTDVRPLGTDDRGSVIFIRLPGDAWELGGGFAVARQKVIITDPMGFISGADERDKRNVKVWLVALLAVGGAFFGLVFSFIEHSMPMREMARQSARLKKGELDQLQLARFRGGFRPIATDINDGIQRVIEKGGGTARKPADLESILGPVPAQPNMSAFSFPMQDGSMAPQQAPQMPPPSSNFNPPGQGPPPPANRPNFPGAPAPVGSAPRPNPLAPPQGPGGPPPPGSRPNPPGFQGNDRTMAMPGGQSPAFGAPAVAAPPPAAPSGHSATVAASPGANNAKYADRELGKDEDEQTMVASPSADLIAATGQNAAVADPAAEWHQVYEEFLKTKRECGEPTDGLTFEKFQLTLKKNRDALIARHGCKRVKFSVYVKEGRASLKATPVRD
jgi:hypothetical protein